MPDFESKVPASIALATDGRPASTPLDATPGTVIYGPAVSREGQWDKVTVEVWHTDSVTRTATLAVLEADGTTVVATCPRSVPASSGPIVIASEWRLRRGLYLSVWWSAVSIGYARIDADQVNVRVT